MLRATALLTLTLGGLFDVAQAAPLAAQRPIRALPGPRALALAGALLMPAPGAIAPLEARPLQDPPRDVRLAPKVLGSPGDPPPAHLESKQWDGQTALALRFGADPAMGPRLFDGRRQHGGGTMLVAGPQAPETETWKNSALGQRDPADRDDNDDGNQNQAVLNEDRRPSLVERPRERRPRRVVWLLSATAGLSAVDLALTVWQMMTNDLFVEANPIARWVVEFAGSPLSLIAFKAASLGVTLGVLYGLRRRLSAEIGAWACVAVLAWLMAQWGLYFYELLHY